MICRGLLLIKNGAKVDDANKEGDTALLIAVKHLEDRARRDVLKLLIEAGADVNKVNLHNGATPLHEVSYRLDFDNVKLLIDAGANINLRDNSNNTCLDIAQKEFLDDANGIEMEEFDGIFGCIADNIGEYGEKYDIHKSKMLAFAMGYHSRLGK